MDDGTIYCIKRDRVITVERCYSCRWARIASPARDVPVDCRWESSFSLGDIARGVRRRFGARDGSAERA